MGSLPCLPTGSSVPFAVSRFFVEISRFFLILYKLLIKNREIRPPGSLGVVFRGSHAPRSSELLWSSFSLLRTDVVVALRKNMILE